MSEWRARKKEYFNNNNKINNTLNVHVELR